MLVPSRAIADGAGGAVARGSAPTGSTRPTGRRPARRRQAQVWVPRSGRRRGARTTASSTALPRLRLVQLLSAGAERFVGRLPEGVLLCNARGAHTPSTAEWAVTATLAAQRGIPFFVREQEAGRWSFTHRSARWSGARVLVVGAGDIGRDDRPDARRLRRRAHLRGAHRPGGRPVHGGAAGAAAARRRRDPHRAGDARDHRHGRRRVPRRDAGRRPAGQRRPRASSSTPTRCSPS